MLRNHNLIPIQNTGPAEECTCDQERGCTSDKVLSAIDIILSARASRKNAHQDFHHLGTNEIIEAIRKYPTILKLAENIANTVSNNYATEQIDRFTQRHPELDIHFVWRAIVYARELLNTKSN